MTKQQTLELLEKQMPSFYSLEQVVDLIKGIEDPAPTVGLSEERIKGLIEAVYDAVRDNVGNLDSDDVCDMRSAEFDLNGNEISLSSVDVNIDGIADAVLTDLEDTIIKFFEEEDEEDEEDEE